MAAKSEQKQTGFRSIFANGSNLPYVSFTKNAAFWLKKALLYWTFFGEKNIRFGSLTSHLLNVKLGKRIGETIFSPRTKEGMKVNTNSRGQ